MKKYMIAFLALLFVVLALVWMPKDTILASFSEQNNVENSIITAKELSKLLSDKANIFLLDVRQPQEYETYHIEGSTLIPLNELAERLSEIPTNKQIVVYCRSGNRSSKAAEILVSNNFTKVKNLVGGVIAWSKAF